MESYVFRDTVTGFDEYDISGTEYKKLLELCCRYSATMSLIMVDRNLPFLRELEPFRVSKKNNINFMHDDYGAQRNEVRYYRVCNEVIDILFNNGNGLFAYTDKKGYSNPNDTTFYRNDGSVFFTCIVHEGIGILLPREDEDISNVVEVGNWNKAEVTKVISTYAGKNSCYTYKVN